MLGRSREAFQVFYVSVRFSASLPNFQCASHEKMPEQELKPPKTEQKQLDKENEGKTNEHFFEESNKETNYERI